jgi:hypothetical protein
LPEEIRLCAPARTVRAWLFPGKIGRHRSRPTMEAWKMGEADRPRTGNARVTYWALRLAGIGCRPSRHAVDRNQKPRCCVASIPSPRSAMARRSTITTPVVHSSVRPPGASRRRARPSQCCSTVRRDALRRTQTRTKKRRRGDTSFELVPARSVRTSDTILRSHRR